jgi:methionine aminopeptidase
MVSGRRSRHRFPSPLRARPELGAARRGPLPLTAALVPASLPPTRTPRVPHPTRPSSSCSDLGVHLDGHIALVATTVVLGASTAAPVTGPRADAIAAAYAAAEVGLRLIQAGGSNTAVTAAFERVAEAYGVRAVPGMSTHQLGRFALEGGKRVPLKGDPEDKTEEATFAAGEAYAIDVAFTTGDAKPRETDARTTVFRRNPDVEYLLKMKASRALLGEVAKKYAAGLPFSLRALGDETQARLGVRECVDHGLLTPFRVEFEREGAAVAHVRFTAVLLSGGTQKVTGGDCPAWVKSDKSRESRRGGGGGEEKGCREDIRLGSPAPPAPRLTPCPTPPLTPPSHCHPAPPAVPADLAELLTKPSFVSKKKKGGPAAAGAGDA